MAESLKVVVQVFARAPVPGACKRRLIPALGADGAAALHRRMVEVTVAAAAAAGADDVELWTAADTPNPFLEQTAAATGARTMPQRGPDLGARMAGALDDAHGRGYGAVLVGCDCPALVSGRIAMAVEMLRKGAACVIRPTLDGGYVCVGTQRAVPDIFQDMPWGTSGVMDATRARLRRSGLRWFELAAVADVDRPPDLRHVPAEWLMA